MMGWFGIVGGALGLAKAVFGWLEKRAANAHDKMMVKAGADQVTAASRKEIIDELEQQNADMGRIARMSYDQCVDELRRLQGRRDAEAE